MPNFQITFKSGHVEKIYGYTKNYYEDGCYVFTKPGKQGTTVGIKFPCSDVKELRKIPKRKYAKKELPPQNENENELKLF